PVGYMQISPEVMHAQVGTIYEQQQAIGYDSAFIEGEAESMRYMQGLFHDWQARNISSVLHERRGGYANNMASMRGLAGKATTLGVEIVAGVTVTPRLPRSRPPPERSRATRSSSASARGSTPSGTCSRSPGRSASRTATA